MAAVCRPTPISTYFETTTITSLVPTASGSTTYVVVDPAAETVQTTFSLVNGVLQPARVTVTGATITTTEALTATETSLIVTSVPVSTELQSCSDPGPPTPSSTTTTSSSTTSSSTTTSSTTTTTSSTTTSSSTTTTSSSTTTTTPPPTTSSSTLVTSSSTPSSIASSTALLPSTNSNASGSSNSSPQNLSAIIGGSVGGGVGALILLGILFFFCCGGRNRRNSKKDSDEWRDPPPFLMSGGGNASRGAGLGAGASGDFEDKDRWDPGSNHAYAQANTSSPGKSRSSPPAPGRLSRRFVGEGAGAALAGGVSAYETAGGARRKSGKFRPADEQDAYYRNTWVPPREDESSIPASSIQSHRPSEPPVSAGFAGVGAGGGGGGGGTRTSQSAAPRLPPQGTFASMLDNATTFDPRARDGGWAVANEPFHQSGPAALGAAVPSNFQPRSQMPPPAPLPLPGIDYRPSVTQQSSQGHGSNETFLVPPSQSRFNRYGAPPTHPHQPPTNSQLVPSMGPPPQTHQSGYDSPAPSHRSIPALGPYNHQHDPSGESERGGGRRGELKVMNYGQGGPSTTAGSEYGGHHGQQPHNFDEREEMDEDPYGGLDAGLDLGPQQQQQRRY